jgi:hypothetical protein
MVEDRNARADAPLEMLRAEIAAKLLGDTAWLDVDSLQAASRGDREARGGRTSLTCVAGQYDRWHRGAPPPKLTRVPRPLSPLTRDVAIYSGPHPMPLGCSGCVMFTTTTPFVDQPVFIVCFVVLAPWLPADEPVGMFVTANQFVDAAGDPLGEVHTVFAAEGFAGYRDEAGQRLPCSPDSSIRAVGSESTLPVEVGRWLFREGLLRRHSPDRTDAGERWALAVGGGPIPPRDQEGTAEAMQRNGGRALARLNAQQWPQWRPL